MGKKWSKAGSTIEEAAYLYGPLAQRRESLIALLRDDTPTIEFWAHKDAGDARIAYSGRCLARNPGRNGLIFQIRDSDLLQGNEHSTVEMSFFQLLAIASRLGLLDRTIEDSFEAPTRFDKAIVVDRWAWTFSMQIHPEWETRVLS